MEQQQIPDFRQVGQRAQVQVVAVDDVQGRGRDVSERRKVDVLKKLELEILEVLVLGSKPRTVGARVARVAVDDATWAAVKSLCGNTPASVRLGQLVAAEVDRSRQSTAEQDAVAAVQAIRTYADELAAFVRRSPPA